MSSRAIRERQYRRILATGVGISVAIHAAVLGFSTFEVPPTLASETETPPAEEVEREFDVASLELVTIVQQPAVAAAVDELLDVNSQLYDLHRKTSRFGTGPSLHSPVLYNHRAESVSPRMVLAELKGQLDVLAERIDQRQ